METRPKVLIVDDEPFNVDYLVQELEDLACDTTSAGDGQAALAQVAAEAPDLILLDIMMPLLDGFEVLARLKADKLTRDIPVIVISAMSDMRSIVRGIEMGAEDFLPKPFDPILLKARLTSSLEKKRLRDQEKLYLRALERELEIGHQIQAGFLPDRLPQPPGWEIAAYFQAAREVAGDFYDAFPLPQNKTVGLVMADVCDKGVGAALYMTLFRSLIRAVSNLEFFTRSLNLAPSLFPPPPAGEEPSPVDSFTRLKNTVTLTNNYVVYTHTRANKFVTLFFGLLDPATGSLVYVNAGHEPPVIAGPGGIRAFLKPTGPVVGMFPHASYGVAEARLEPGEVLLAYTDGVTDARDAAGQMFGQERLLAYLDRPVPMARALLDTIQAGLAGHIAGSSQYDDITMLAVRRQ